MNKWLIIGLLFCVQSAWTQSNTKDLRQKGLKKYPVERCLITYKMTPDTLGSETLLFDNYGWRSLKKQSILFEIYETIRTISVFEITDGETIYRLNPMDSTYTKRTNKKWSQQAHLGTSNTSKNILFDLGGTHSSDTTLLDKKCEIWTFPGKGLIEIWVWNGMVLKRENYFGDKQVIFTASDINTQLEIDTTLFQIPPHYTFKKD